MARGRGFGNKDPFSALDQEWKDGINSMSEEDIKKRVAEIALELDKLLEAKKQDEDLKEQLSAAKLAGQVYSDGRKGAQLRIRYAQTILEARGKA